MILQVLTLLILLWCQMASSNSESEFVECHELPDRGTCGEYTGCKWRRKTQACIDMEPVWMEHGEMVDLETLPTGVDEYGGIHIKPTNLQQSPPDKLDTSTIVTISNCISESVVETLQSLQKDFTRETLVDDRTDELVFSHVVHRVEPILKKKYPDLLSGLLSLMLQTDSKMWNVMKEPLQGSEEIPEYIYPEIEYLIYEPNEKPGFERHRDNGSVITAIFMLKSHKSGDYEGGQLIFDPDRVVQLEKCDCVIFRGNEVFHRVNRLSAGRREVMQIELHLNHESEGGREFGLGDDDVELEEEDEIRYSL